MNSKKNHLFIVWLNGIGDFVMAIPALCEFQKTNNFTEITILCRNDMSSILSKTTIFQEIPIRQIITNKKKPHYDIHLFYKLRQLNADIGVTIFPTQGISSALLLLYSGAKLRYHHIYNFKWFKNIHWGINKHAPILLDTHFSIQMNNLLNHNVRTVKGFGSYFSKTTVRSNDIGIHCCTSNHKEHREWTIENWHKTIEFLLKEDIENIHIFWGKNDLKEMKKFKEKIPKKNIIHHYNLKLGQLMNKVWQCKFLISIDSSIGHLASIQEIPQIVLFGPFNETYSKPLNINAIILRPKDTISSFKPYYDRFNNNLPKVTDIKVTDVTTSIKELLKKQH